MSLTDTSASPADLAALRAGFAQLRAEQASARYYDDPVAWVRDVLGAFPWSRQAEVMASVARERLVTVQSAHGVGKTRLASWLVLWFLATRPAQHTRVVTSAPTAHQVRAVLWEYIRQGHEVAELPGYITQGQVPEWKIDGHLVGYGRKPSDHQQSSFQGTHADHMLVILDEAGGIPKWLWDAADSLMTSESDQHLLAIGNPDDNSSHFATVCTVEPRWKRFRISAFDSPAYTGEDVPDHVRTSVVGPNYVEDKRERWGESSSLYRVKVLGEFVDSEAGMIPLSWVIAANRRWQDWWDSDERLISDPPGRTMLGVDVGHEGEDKTVIATRKGPIITEIEDFINRDTVEVEQLVVSRLSRWARPLAVVDAVGIGIGVVDNLRHAGHDVVAFKAGNSTRKKDSTGELKFADVRSCAWWHLREMLDPSRAPTLALPPNDYLTADLITPRWEERTGAVIKVEKKAEIRKRLKRSTDFGDAVVQALSPDLIPRGDADQAASARRAGARTYNQSSTWQPATEDRQRPRRRHKGSPAFEELAYQT